MWILTPDDPTDAMVNLQNYHHVRVEQIDEQEFALVAYACANECCDFAVIKKGMSPEPLQSIALGIGSCSDPVKGMPHYPLTTPTLH